MTARGALDGAVVSQGGQEWILHDEQTEDGRFAWSECGTCHATVLGGDDSRAMHLHSWECENCGKRTARPPADFYAEPVCSWQCFIDLTGFCLCGDPMCPQAAQANAIRHAMRTELEP